MTSYSDKLGRFTLWGPMWPQRFTMGPVTTTVGRTHNHKQGPNLESAVPARLVFHFKHWLRWSCCSYQWFNHWYFDAFRVRTIFYLDSTSICRYPMLMSVFCISYQQSTFHNVASTLRSTATNPIGVSLLPIVLCSFKLSAVGSQTFPVSAAKISNVVSASCIDLLWRQLKTFISSSDRSAVSTFMDPVVVSIA